MANDVFQKSDLDIRVFRGDSVQIRLALVDRFRNPFDINELGMKFTVTDPLTEEVVPMLVAITTYSKEHTQGGDTGDGISFSQDTDLAAKGLTLTANNQLIIVLDAADTAQLRPMPHRWDLEITADFNNSKTTLAGRLLVLKDETI